MCCEPFRGSDRASRRRRFRKHILELRSHETPQIVPITHERKVKRLIEAHRYSRRNLTGRTSLIEQRPCASSGWLSRCACICIVEKSLSTPFPHSFHFAGNASPLAPRNLHLEARRRQSSNHCREGHNLNSPYSRHQRPSIYFDHVQRSSSGKLVCRICKAWRYVW